MKNDGKILLQSLLWQNPWISLTPGPKFSCGRTGHSKYLSHLAWMQNSISSRELSYCFLPESLGHLKTKYVDKGMRSQGTCVKQKWRLWRCSGTGGFLSPAITHLWVWWAWWCTRTRKVFTKVVSNLFNISVYGAWNHKGSLLCPLEPCKGPQTCPREGNGTGPCNDRMARGGVLRTGGWKEKTDLHHLLLKNLSFAKIFQLSAAATPQCRFSFLDGTKDPADNKICLGSSASIQNH